MEQQPTPVTSAVESNVLWVKQTLPTPDQLRSILIDNLGKELQDLNIAIDYALIMNQSRKIRRRLKKIRRLANKKISE